MRYALLKECRDTLLRVRTLKHNELGPSVTAELDAVIETMTLLLETDEAEIVVNPAQKKWILVTIGRIAVCLDWVRRIGQRFLE